MSSKQTISTALAMAIVALAAGCIPSLYPVYRDQDVVMRHELLGRWSSEKDGQSWQFTQRDGDSYKLVIVDNKGQSGAFVAHLTEIGGEPFMDLYPIRGGGDKQAFHNLHLIPAHTFYRVDLQADTLGLSFIDPEWLKKNAAGYPELSWERPNENSILLTTQTPVLRGFVAGLLEVEGAFTTPFQLTKTEDKAGG